MYDTIAESTSRTTLASQIQSPGKSNSFGRCCSVNAMLDRQSSMFPDADSDDRRNEGRNGFD